MSGFELRPMRRDDLAAVVALIGAHEEEDGALSRVYFERFFSGLETLRDDVNHVVVEPPGDVPVAVGGYGPGPFEWPGTIWLRWLYAAPGYRSRGLGRLLMRRILEEVRRLETRKLYLDTSSYPSYERAVRVYEHYGFRLEGRLVDYYDDGEDLLIYGLDLTS